jgi:hypothetical protein
MLHMLYFILVLWSLEHLSIYLTPSNLRFEIENEAESNRRFDSLINFNESAQKGARNIHK